MKVLVTGGAGYIGSNTLVELIAAGHEIFVVDNLVNGKKSTIDAVMNISNQRFVFFDCDITNRENLSCLLDKVKPDVVMHFAGVKSVNESISNPIYYYDNNFYGTSCLLHSMDQVGCKKIIFSSSATVYDPKGEPPYTESHPTRPINPYGRSKLFSENILEDWASLDRDRSAICLRYFNPAGAHTSGALGEDPRVEPTNLMPIILKVASQSIERLNVFGGDYPTDDGSCERDYIHVTDLAKGHVAALDRVRSLLGYNIFNLGSGEPTSVLDLVMKFSLVTGVEIPYQIVSRRLGDSPRSWASVEKSKRILGWQTVESLDSIIYDSFNWLTKNSKDS